MRHTLAISIKNRVIMKAINLFLIMILIFIYRICYESDRVYTNFLL